MEILFVAGVSPITTDVSASRAFYRDHLGLPLEVVSGDYVASDAIEGVKHFGLWPLVEAAQSCFGTPQWPADLVTPTMTIEFEVADVAAAAHELVSKGNALVHAAKTEPWGQTIARVLSPEGILIGLCYTPWFHE